MSTFDELQPAGEEPDATLPAADLPAPGALRARAHPEPTLDASAHPETIATRTTLHGGAAGAAASASRSNADELAPGALFDRRFEVLSVLGEGGMGRVYQVRDRTVGNRVLALKLIRRELASRAEFRERFLSEIKHAQEFVHENVNQVRDSGETAQGKLYFTMDFVEGESLRSLLDREGRLAPQHAVEIARQLLRGLASGHQRGLVHADVKPANLMLASRTARTPANPFGVSVRLLDFGIASSAAAFSERSISGTPTYMSPEQAQGQRLDGRSDLFAVGVLLYEMLSGERPFAGTTVRSVMKSVLEVDVRPLVDGLRELDPRLKAVLRTALEKDREKRFQNASEFVAALDQAMLVETPARLPTWSKVAGVLLLALAGLAVWRTAALGTAVVFGRELPQLQDSRGQLTADLQIARSDLQKSQAAAAALEQRLERANGDLERQSKRLTELEQADGNRQQDLDQARQQREAFKQQLDEAHHALQELESQVKSQQLMIDGLQNRASDPVAATRSGVAYILRALDEPAAGAATRARKIYGGLETSAPLSERVPDGLDAIDALVRSYEELAAAAGAAAPERRAALARAAQAAGEAEHRLGALRADPPPWMRAEPAAPAAERLLEQSEAALNRARTRVAREQQQLAEDQRERWQQLSANLLSTDAAALLAAAADFEDGPERQRQVIADYTAQLDALVVRDDRLQLDALRAALHLPAWMAAVEHRPGAAQASETRRLRAYAYARAWYDGSPDNDPSVEDLEQIDIGAERGWRKLLELSIRIADPRSGFPLGTELSSVSVRRIPGMEPEFDHETGKRRTPSPNRDEEVWELERVSYTSSGVQIQESSENRQRTYRRSGSRYTQDGAKAILFDAKSTSGLGVGEFALNLDTPLPASIGITATLLESFRRAFAQSDRACLIVDDGERELWISPVWGLVREQHRQGRQVELLFSTPR